MKKYLSVCSGIEAASVAWEPLGWEPIGFSEIEAFPNKVLKIRFPNTPNFGDMTRYGKWPIEPGSVDVLIGGTPCQSFSVAGLRKGLSDPRGNLALVYLGLVDHVRPQWTIWENVPGVMSSGSGRDFGSLIGALAELGYGFAWRVLDAQFWGVAQRRRRLFLVGYLGNWRPAATVLFEPEGCSRNYPSRRQTGEGIAPDSACGFGTSDQEIEDGFTLTSAELAPTICVSGPPYSRTGMASAEAQALVAIHSNLNGSVYGFQPGITRREGNPTRFSEGIAPTLTANAGDNQPACVIPQPVSFGNVAIKTTNHQGDRVVGDGDIFPTLSAQGANNGGGPGSLLYQHTKAAVRRLTPIECERLQGFPDNWTQIPLAGEG